MNSREVSVLIIIFVHVFIGDSCCVVFAEFSNRFKIANSQVDADRAGCEWAKLLRSPEGSES